MRNEALFVIPAPTLMNIYIVQYSRPITNTICMYNVNLKKQKTKTIGLVKRITNSKNKTNMVKTSLTDRRYIRGFSLAAFFLSFKEIKVNKNYVIMFARTWGYISLVQ